MELNKAKQILKENGYLMETRTNTRFGRQIFKNEPKISKENSLIAAFEELKQLSNEEDWDITEQYYELEELNDTAEIKKEAKEAAEAGFYLNVIQLKKYLGEDFVSIELRFDDGKPNIRVELGDDYAWSERRNFSITNVAGAIKFANKLYEEANKEE